MLSPIIISIIFAVSILFITLGIVKPKIKLFSEPDKETKENLQDKLDKAGIVDITADFLIFIMLVIAGCLFLALLLVSTNIFYAVVAAVLVYPGTLIYLSLEARKFNDKIMSRLVSFIRKIESQIRVNKSVSNAFVTAVKEDKLLYKILGPEIKSLELNEPFAKVLKDTTKKIPLRPWFNFVKALEIYEESGGKLTDVLSNNVKRINSKILLKERLMGDLSPYKSQMLVIIIFAIATPILLFIIGGDVFGSIFSSTGTIIALIVAIIMDIVAIIIVNSAIKDVERRLDA